MTDTPPKPEIPSLSAEEISRKMTKSEAINLRVTPDEKEVIKDAASKLGLTVTDYLVRLGVAAAEKIERHG